MPNLGVMIYPVAARLDNDQQMEKIAEELDEVIIERAAGNREDMIRELFDLATAAITMARNNCIDAEEMYEFARETAEKNNKRGYFENGKNGNV